MSTESRVDPTCPVDSDTCQVDGGAYAVSVIHFRDGVHFVAKNGRYTFRVRAVDWQPAHPIELMVAQEGVHQPPTVRDCDVALESMKTSKHATGMIPRL